MDDEVRSALRGATYRGDCDQLVALLAEVDIDLVLQLTGGGVLAAVFQGVEGAPELAERFIESLDDRRWDGDAELAAELGAALGAGAGVALDEITVDLDELSVVLEDARFGGGAINLRDGEVWSRPALEYFIETDEEEPDLDDDEEWLIVGSQSSRHGYWDMEAFIDTVEDPELSDRLATAIRGRGAFGRFREVLHGVDNLLDHWYAFSDDRRFGRARAWLAEAGYRPKTGRRLRLVR